MHANVMNLHAFDFVFELILPQPHSPNTFSHRHASSNTHSHSHPPRTHFLTAPFPEHIFSQPLLADHTFAQHHFPNTSSYTHPSPTTLSYNTICRTHFLTATPRRTHTDLTDTPPGTHLLTASFPEHTRRYQQPLAEHTPILQRPLPEHTFSQHHSPNTFFSHSPPSANTRRSYGDTSRNTLSHSIIPEHIFSLTATPRRTHALKDTPPGTHFLTAPFPEHTRR